MYLLKEQELESACLFHLKVVPGHSTATLLKSNPVTTKMVVNLIDIPGFI